MAAQEAGEHLRIIVDRLGHANPMVGMTTHAHPFDGLEEVDGDTLTLTVAFEPGTGPRMAGVVARLA